MLPDVRKVSDLPASRELILDYALVLSLRRRPTE
jgi:hypothetical protein